MMIYLLLGIFIGVLLGAGILYLALKSSQVPRKNLDALNAQFIKTQSDFQNANTKIEDLGKLLDSEKQINLSQAESLLELKNDLSKISAVDELQKNQIAEQQIINKNQNVQIEELQRANKMLFAKNTELSSHNEFLKKSLETQKEEIIAIQENATLQFEKVANRILEEKTEKFTHLNQNQLKNILEPFSKNIDALKQTVNETYDKESKERFSLGSKVKELAELNQQISEDAKKLTRALKGESKTQGNWGEMILESILEKSGLVKNREYFLQEQLKGDDNRYLQSDFEGRKMQPDAVVKYPDNRNVIIDSKVSLTAFTQLIDENDPDIYKLHLNQHLQSIKNHINQLSNKGYDDYDKSLDFVMMFIPSEPAYIAAMQADPELWNYAYDKRILLLNPTNLITSLKLIVDLWKREYQNKNAMEIAEQGAKLYDKFVGFVENLDKVGERIEQAKKSYDEAYGQLYSGRGNLINQTQNLKKLGIKNKKDLPQNLIDQSNDTQGIGEENFES
ncbi:MAG: DNA recombination protein RmuC [Cloacibacterium sp.]|nr:DNA recombination protein RmuC [Cloacibacterium sp.]